MNRIGSSAEREPVPKDISQEFSDMDVMDFLSYLRKLKNEPALSITVDWKDAPTARRLKAFLENKPIGQKRFAAIRATEEQHDQEPNVFASAVKWEKV